MGWSLWLDDVRDAPQGWVHSRSVRQAIQELSARGAPELASLDHDLGDFAGDGGDGFRLVLWMAENDVWPLIGIRVHSSNAPGRLRMLADIDHYGPFPIAPGVVRGGW
jgi:hypothetical protein